MPQSDDALIKLADAIGRQTKAIERLIGLISGEIPNGGPRLNASDVGPLSPADQATFERMQKRYAIEASKGRRVKPSRRK